MRVRLLTALVLALAVSQTALALDPNRLPGQYIRDHWTKEQGYAGGPVNAIAQTPDGYLWIGGQDGLVRFDGLNFQLFNHANNPVLPSTRVVTLATDPDGDLWILMQNLAVYRYRRGAIELMGDASGVTAMGRGKDGGVLVARTFDPLRFRDQKFTHIPMAPEYSGRLVMSVTETPDGRLWMGTRDYGLFAVRDGKGEAPPGLPDRKVNCLLPVGPEAMWVGTDRGLALWNGHVLTQNGLPPALRDVQVLAVTRDRDSNIWLGTNRGLMRLTAQSGFALEQPPPARAEAVSALLEDREGNLWIGNTQGIERLRDGIFFTYPKTKENSEHDGPLYVDKADRTWFAPSDGGLFWLQGTERHEVKAAGLDHDIVYSITGGDGEVWVGRQRGGLTRLRPQGSKWDAETFTAADGLAAGSVYSVYRSRDGAVWAGTLSNGVSRLSGGRITTYSTADGLASNAISAIEDAADGTIWFATANGLTSFREGHWRVYTSQDGLPPGRLNCLFSDGEGILWIGTDVGIAYLRNGRVQAPRNVPDPLLDEVVGIVSDARGGLWIATSKSVLRTTRTALLEDPPSDFPLRVFGAADGIPATEGVRRDRPVATDSTGRIWFSLRPGISVVNPARLVNDSVPAIVHMESVTVDGRPQETGPGFRLPATAQRVRFSYLALSLSVPGRVQYRYRLDGFEKDWSEPVAARDTSYTNLGPGPYRFRVIACNSQGIWNSAEASVGFEVVPAVWQTLWFQMLIVGVCATLAMAIYRWRLRHHTEQLRVRFDERLAERTRIAQELHDTLLQGLLATSMQLHVAVDRIPEDSPFRAAFDRVTSMMQQVANDSRGAVRGLRNSAVGADDLESAFSRVHDECAPGGMEFRIVVEGPARPLNPLTRDEVYRIGREALSNAFRHSAAAQVEMEIRYGSRDLRLAIRDNGRGIDENILRTGKDGHWGLVGMHERAKALAARLRIWSRVTAGTELELIVPAHVAYASVGRTGPWWGKWRRPAVASKP